ncbi:GntR family transcriptional regulator [Nitratireductor pacificus]|uniref:Putative GntR family transcriptional regulator n=1 Tax=Nitratireductor pacificus pht-3B TaxID=391937 RepID=K2MEN9_9HYPH|nr:GntR family transcriptional regulator [Nitratireductor pacificus]EKF19160.1 putative GntR family transcriptional regulator [Nitratireductor pacificus pht-3B]
MKTGKRDAAGRPEQRVRAKGTSVSEAYDRLRADILDLTLSPGMLLDEREQVARLRLSRTPIHEAFVRLAAEGLIIMQPNRQAQIAPLDIRDLPLYVEATDIAHRTVVHLAARRRTESDLAAMDAAATEFEAAVSRGDPLQMTEANRQFHSTVAGACHNPYLAAHYNHLLTLGLRVLRSSHVYGRLEAADLQRQAREHRDIIAAISRGDAAEAELLAQNHTRAFVDLYVRSLQENLAADIAIRPREP